jgi:hypothetical protein
MKSKSKGASFIFMNPFAFSTSMHVTPNNSFDLLKIISIFRYVDFIELLDHGITRSGDAAA